MNDLQKQLQHLDAEMRNIEWLGEYAGLNMKATIRDVWLDVRNTLIRQHAEKGSLMTMQHSWDGVHSAIAGLGLDEVDLVTLKYDLHRVFGDKPDSAQLATDWLNRECCPCGGAPRDVLRGIVPDVPREIGVPRVLSYLRHAPDAPG